MLLDHLLKISKEFRNLWKQEIHIYRYKSDKVLKEKAFEIANNQKYDGYQRDLASMVYNFFDKKSKGTGTKSMPN